MEIPYFELVIVFILITKFVDTYLDYRQYEKFKTITQLPSELEEFIPREVFDKSREYGADRLEVSMGVTIFDSLHTLFLLIIGAIPWLWGFSESTINYFGFSSDYLVTRCVVFLLIFELENIFVHLPFSLYSTFVVEEKYGFNKQTLKFYFLDQLKMLVVNLVLFVPIFSLVLHLIDWGGEYFWIYVWLATFLFTLAFATIYPEWIAPIFNKYTPFPQGELRTQIEELAQKVQFPLKKLFVVDGSIRSAHSNAYVYGFFKNKRIVVYDTLLKQVDNQGVLAILGHELGHYKLNHTVYNLILNQIQILFFFYLFGLIQNNRDLFVAFGFPDPSRPTFIGLVLFSLLYQPISYLSGLAHNALSRRFEYQADSFARSLGYDLTQPLAKIHHENLANMSPDPWYSFAKYGHPTVVERIRALSMEDLRSR